MTAAVVTAASMSGCMGYLLHAGAGQARLLRSREPIAALEAEGGFSVGQEQRLALIPEILAAGHAMGLASTDNYQTLAVGQEGPIWNLSGCAPLSFSSATWRFPIVGEVPYLGFFDRPTADAWEARLRADGFETWVRPAGAYSTLGWFKDPVLPAMLRWSEDDLAETLLHELAHATIWLPGSVDFNESFASFVGEQAADRYLAQKYGEASPEVVDYRALNHDYRSFQRLLHDAYNELDALYQKPNLSADDKAYEKKKIYASLPKRVEASDILHKDRYLAALQRGEWNNARLAQYRTYNTAQEDFLRLYEQEGEDFPKFIARLQQIVTDQQDPFVAVQAAAGGGVQKF